MRGRRGAVVLAAAVAWLVAGAGPARADPAGPTDYESSIVDIDPPLGGFEAEMIGGDSFLLLEVDSRAEVEVLGYRGEPYLRFLPGGAVERNDRSPTTYLNRDRYAAVQVPASASADAEPLWREVATDGSYAWHDHRAHWMNEARPPGRDAGDVILEGVVPLLVGGSEVDLTIRSVWQPTPSPAPVVGGAAAGLGLAVAVFRRGIVPAVASAIAVLSAAGLAVGAAAFLSVPAETAPSPMLWAAPAASLLLGLSAVAAAAETGWTRALQRGAPNLVLASAVILTVWGWIRWEWLWRSILPTGMPFWIDRMATAATITGGVGLAAATVRTRLSGGPVAD